MKVKELIELLKKQNQDANVHVKDNDGQWCNVEDVTGNPMSCVVEVKIHGRT
jgi:hypothetical protein